LRYYVAKIVSFIEIINTYEKKKKKKILKRK
jgi:hypothetical protein